MTLPDASRSRPPAVAGMFYPAAPARLAALVDELLAAAGPAAPVEAAAAPAGPVKALIAPHAGYVYSGPTAGIAFAALAERAPAIERVVLLGPAHRVPWRGLALPESGRFDTPLGSVPVDLAGAEALAGLPQVAVSEVPHRGEHSLEVELPFLQRLLGDFTLLPLVVGSAGAAEVAAALERVWGGPETVVVVSSDLSHYLPYADASRRDRATARRILALDPDLEPEEACGARPINGLLAAAPRAGLTAELLDLRSSGDTAGDRDAVVGYGAFAFRERGGGAA